MKRILAILILFINVYYLFAQTVDEIKNNPSVIWAEGIGSSLLEADKMALAEVSRQISVEVKTKTGHISINDNGNHKVTQSNEIHTQSSAIFYNIEMRVLSEKPEFRVIRWINKAEIKKQQEDRLAKLQEMVRVANTALQSKQISDAIRYYYWAYSLLCTLPQQSSIIVEDENYDSQIANIWIPYRLKNIFSKIKCSVVGKSSEGLNDYDIVFLYDGSPVVNVDYTYFDGTDWSPVCCAMDGKSVVELRPSYMPERLQIKYEYKFNGEARSDKEVEKVINSVSPSFDRYCFSSANLSSSLQEKKQVEKQFKQIEIKIKENANSLTVNTRVVDMCDNVMRQIIDAIKHKNYSSISSCFTPDGMKVFNKLINYGKAKIIGSELKLTYTQLGEEIICRSIPMNFTFSGNRKFSEEVVFTFNEEGLIDNISFGLGKVAQDYLMGNVNSSFTPEKRQLLANFLECFKTAYALKRIDYLEQLFDDDALIITGKVLKKFTGNVELGYNSNSYVQLTTHDKATYIKRLRKSFANKEFINIKFANNRIRHTKVEGVYAIQIKQDYFSSNYGDTGYLFLIIDVRNPKEPIIHVRAWQEKPDPQWGILGPEFF